MSQLRPDELEHVAGNLRRDIVLEGSELFRLRENFYITTSCNFRTHALTNVISEVGIDRVLYSVDYPFEDMVEAGDWFDHAAISEAERA